MQCTSSFELRPGKLSTLSAVNPHRLTDLPNGRCRPDTPTCGLTAADLCRSNNAGAGAIALTLAGTRRAQVTFSNQGTTGTVTALLGATPLGTAAAGETTTVTFTYNNGDVLSLTEDTGIIGLAQGSILCGADVCNTVDIAAVNDFTSIDTMSDGGWDVSSV